MEMKGDVVELFTGKPQIVEYKTKRGETRRIPISEDLIKKIDLKAETTRSELFVKISRQISTPVKDVKKGIFREYRNVGTMQEIIHYMMGIAISQPKLNKMKEFGMVSDKNLRSVFAEVQDRW